MENFERALKVGLVHEGRRSNDPADPGGFTDYGISLKFLKDEGIDVDGDGDIDADDIRALTPEKVMEVYRDHFWTPEHCAAIVELGPAQKLFDMCVNMGLPRAARIVQAAVNELGGPVKLTVDGHLGPVSLAAINTALDRKALVERICKGQADFYRSLVAHRPPSAKFLPGWLVRANCSLWTPCKTCVAKHAWD